MYKEHKDDIGILMKDLSMRYQKEKSFQEENKGTGRECISIRSTGGARRVSTTEFGNKAVR